MKDMIAEERDAFIELALHMIAAAGKMDALSRARALRQASEELDRAAEWLVIEAQGLEADHG